MPKQAAEPAEDLAGNEFSNEEPLYRLLEVNGVDEGSVTMDAIDLEGTSVDRGKFRASAEEALAFANDARFIAVAVCAFQDLPPSLANEANTATREIVVVYKPENGNQAHSEVRICQPGETINKKPKSKQKAYKAYLKERLSRCFHLAVPPTPVDGDSDDDEFE